MAQDPIAEIAALLEEKGSRRYGLSTINQRAHALQAAAGSPSEAGCDAALVTAALLHDIGQWCTGWARIPRRTASTTGTRNWAAPTSLGCSGRR